LARTGPRCKKSTGVRYCPIAEFLAQASTGRAKNEVQRAKSVGLRTNREIQRNYMTVKKRTEKRH